MVQLSVVSDEIGLSFLTAAQEAARAGISRMEVRTLCSGRVPDCSAAEIAEVSRIAHGEGITLTAISPGFFKRCRDEAAFVEELENRLPRAFEVADKLNAGKMILFGFACEGRGAHDVPWMHSCLQRIEAEFQKHHLKALIEPEPICVIQTAIDAMGLLADANVTSIGINADPGNAGWTGADAARDIETALSRVEHLHVKDLTFVTPNCKPAWVMFGDGEIDYPVIFAKLIASDYHGEIALEPHLPAGTWSLADYASRVRNTMALATGKKENEIAWQ